MASLASDKRKRCDSVFQDEFREDLRHWVETDRRVAQRVLDLVESVLRAPFQGIAMPEPLKHMGANIRSRRIRQEHRLVYLVRDERIDFLLCRYRYRPPHLSHAEGQRADEVKGLTTPSRRGTRRGAGSGWIGDAAQV